MSHRKKATKYVLIVVFFIIFLFLMYYFSQNKEEEIVLPNFLINTNAEVVVKDIPAESNTNSTARDTQ